MRWMSSQFLWVKDTSSVEPLDVCKANSTVACDTILPLEKAWLWFSPYNLVLSLLIVGDDILGVPFARRSLTKSLLQWEKVPRNEADEEFVNKSCFIF